MAEETAQTVVGVGNGRVADPAGVRRHPEMGRVRRQRQDRVTHGLGVADAAPVR